MRILGLCERSPNSSCGCFCGLWEVGGVLVTGEYSHNWWGATAGNYRFIMISIVQLNSVATRALCATRHSAVEKQLDVYCILLFKLIQRTAIVSSGHPWLRQHISLSTARHVESTKPCRLPAIDWVFQRSRAFLVAVTCQMPCSWIIILTTTDPGVAMATVSIIMSAVLTGCSHSNNVCNRGSAQIKPFRCEMCAWEEPRWTEVWHTHTHSYRPGIHSSPHSKWIDKSPGSFFFFCPFLNKPISTTTI